MPMIQPILLAVLCAVANASLFAILFLIMRRRALRRALVVSSESPREVAGRHEPRMTLPMSSGVNIPTGRSAKITSRPSDAPFRPDEIFISSPEEWAIDVVTINDKPQLPGGAVRADSLGPSIPWDVVGRGQELAMTVTYLGDREGGAPFTCAILGRPVDLGSIECAPPSFPAGTPAGAVAG
jgi:hypothetical protein